MHNAEMNSVRLRVSLQKQFETNLIFLWPCIINNDGEEESQLDARITVY